MFYNVFINIAGKLRTVQNSFDLFLYLYDAVE